MKSQSIFRNCIDVIFAMVMLVVSIGPAKATVINVNDGPKNISFSSTGVGYNLGVTGTFDLISMGSTSATLRIFLSNSSTVTGGGTILRAKDVRLTSFGFGVSPNASTVAFVDAADGGMIGATLGSLPSLGQIEVCTFGGNNCNGGANDGLVVGASDTFDIVLTGLFSDPTSLTFDPIGVKFQTNNGSFEFTNDPVSVPEPTPIALLGIGVLGVAFCRKTVPVQRLGLGGDVSMHQ